MKTFKEFIFEENANKIVQFKRKLAGATDPAESERLKKLIADAELQSKKFKAPEVPKKAGPGTRAGGSNQVIPGQPNVSKIPTPIRQLGGLVMPALNVAGAAYDTYTGTQERQAKGERLRTAIPKSAAEAGGGVAGATTAATLASKLLPKNPVAQIGGSLIAGTLGYYGGRTAVSDVLKKIEGNDSDKELEKKVQNYGVRKARSGMAASNVYGATKGSALTGLGGSTKVDTKAGTLTTKDKTVKLASTQLVRDPTTGQQRVGDLAYRGGKATYLARPSTASRDSSASPGGAWRNLQRGLNFGGQRERDQAAAKTEYRTALKNTQTYNKGLGITTKSATAQNLPGYGSAPAPKPTPTPKPKPKPDIISRRMGNAFGMG